MRTPATCVDNQDQPLPPRGAPTQIGAGIPGGATCLPEEPQIPQAPVPSLELEILDLSQVIDIYAEGKAVEAFEAEMRVKNTGFKMVTGFFKKSVQRMGRDAWVGSKKREIIQQIKTDLDQGNIQEEFLRNHIQSGDTAIEDKLYLAHEVVQKDIQDDRIDSLVNEYFQIDQNDINGRRAKLVDLSHAIRQKNPKIVTDYESLEKSLGLLEQVKLSSELDIISAKLKIVDSGRINQGGGIRKDGFLVKMADSIAKKINSSSLPDWTKQKVLGFVRHPNTAAVVSALATRSAVTSISAATAATFLGGFLLPVAVGAGAGGLFASVRAKRELRDRTNQNNRRNALGDETGNPIVDGKSFDVTVHDAKQHQAPVAPIIHELKRISELPGNAITPDLREKAWGIGLCYLLRHKVGREMNINMLQYTSGKQNSHQHVEVIRYLKKIVPDLISDFNEIGAQNYFYGANTSDKAVTARTKYESFQEEMQAEFRKRSLAESKYGKKQGIQYALVAGAVGSAIQGILYMNTSGGSVPTQTSQATTIPPSPQPQPLPVSGGSISSYPDNLKPVSILRDFWYDNKTPSPVFDRTELMLRVKGDEWNVASLLGKTATATGHGVLSIQASDFSQLNVRGVLTLKDGTVFALPIDSHGVLQIPKSLQSIFDEKSFKLFEVSQVVSDSNASALHTRPIISLRGTGTGLFSPVIIEAPIPTPPTSTSPIPLAPIPTPPTSNPTYFAFPWGGTPYNPLGERRPRHPREPLNPPPQNPPADQVEAAQAPVAQPQAAPSPDQAPPVQAAEANRNPPPQNPPDQAAAEAARLKRKNENDKNRVFGSFFSLGKDANGKKLTRQETLQEYPYKQAFIDIVSRYSKEEDDNLISSLDRMKDIFSSLVNSLNFPLNIQNDLKQGWFLSESFAIFHLLRNHRDAYQKSFGPLDPLAEIYTTNLHSQHFALANYFFQHREHLDEELKKELEGKERFESLSEAVEFGKKIEQKYKK